MSSKPKPNSVKGDGEPGLVPKLRFPAFRSAPAWDLKRGDALFDAINNRSAAPGLPVLAITQEHGAIPRDHIDYHVSATAESIATYKEVCVGDFIISLRSFQGGIEYSRFHGICSPAYVILRRKGAGVDDYFRHLFKSARFIQQLTRNIEGLRDGKMISYAQFSEQMVRVPGSGEQEKIADCLNSVDELIAAQGRKLHALRAHKRGLLQSMFPREGEIVPRLRLPEYRTAPDWTESTVGTWCKSFSGGTPDTTKKEYYGGTIPFIRSAEIGSDATELFLTDAGLKNSAAKLVKTGDVLVALYGANSGDVAIAKIDGAINQAILCLRPAGSQAFLYHYLTALQDWVTATYLQGGQGNLSGDIVKSIPIRLPSPEEQASIANGLAVADQLLAVQSQLLGFLNAHKVGLLQNLFPPAREVRA